MKKTMTIREVAKRLGCTLKYVYDLVYAGRLAAEKKGRCWRVSASAVDSWLKNREAKNG
jgi:excisionase family DNA binding protein